MFVGISSNVIVAFVKKGHHEKQARMILLTNPCSLGFFLWKGARKKWIPTAHRGKKIRSTSDWKSVQQWPKTSQANLWICADTRGEGEKANILLKKKVFIPNASWRWPESRGSRQWKWNLFFPPNSRRQHPLGLTHFFSPRAFWGEVPPPHPDSEADSLETMFPIFPNFYQINVQCELGMGFSLLRLKFWPPSFSRPG